MPQEEKLMRKISDGITKSYAPVKLYIDDLKSIYGILQKIGGQIKVENNGCLVENLDLLRNLDKDKTNHFTFTVQNDSYKTGGYVKITFHEKYNELYFAENTEANRLILSEIKQVLRKRRLPLGYFGHGKWTGIIISILSMIVITLPYVGVDFSKWHSIGYVYLVVTTGYFVLYSFSTKEYATIMLKNKIDEFPFWTRNKEKIAMGISAGFLGATIVFILMFQFAK
jgi:hypothetical protein